ncbi:hypothetical protein O6H91_15G089600 [Diphasiastrum complanatum]|uniref:Uncharacterized protein n=1 Tax=Diphasiastrum complanatum TaxID=34168 RepID=A0ACC2BKQ9_DIPCM|nr:hypothetical protein O6H91_15G089600 [Diphasiastrum complanatum]
MGEHVVLDVNSPSSIAFDVDSLPGLSIPTQHVQGFGLGNKDGISYPVGEALDKADSSEHITCSTSTCIAIKYDEALSTSRRKATGDGSIECRICQEEDDKENLEAPCACSGSLKYAHRKCVQRWCDEKGDTICEICQQTYKSGYEVPDRPIISDGSTMELRYSLSNGHWGFGTDSQAGVRDPRVLAMLQAEYEEYTTANANSAACLRSAALVLMALLLLHHGLEFAAPSLDEDLCTFFTIFLLKAVGFLLPCYIMARAVNMLQRRRQRQEATMVATEVSILLRAAQARRMQLSIAPGPFVEH